MHQDLLEQLQWPTSLASSANADPPSPARGNKPPPRPPILAATWSCTTGWVVAVGFGAARPWLGGRLVLGAGV